jgi:hypothetical protein
MKTQLFGKGYQGKLLIAAPSGSTLNMHAMHAYSCPALFQSQYISSHNALTLADRGK